MKKFFKFGIPLLLVILIAAAFLAPIGPLPGFFIRGTEATAPATWPNTSDVHEIRLAVPGTIPRVVIIWVIDYESDLYVMGNAESGWVQMLGDGGPVRMRLGDNTYALTATTVTENRIPIVNAWMDKYRPDYPDIVGGFPSPEEAGDTHRVFKLSRS
ncbi:MAG: hypothetical protein AAF387_08610 [Pseudomonadota bacterium]